jgi:hypothetical protein
MAIKTAISFMSLSYEKFKLLGSDGTSRRSPAQQPDREGGPTQSQLFGNFEATSLSLFSRMIMSFIIHGFAGEKLPISRFEGCSGVRKSFSRSSR